MVNKIIKILILQNCSLPQIIGGNWEIKGVINKTRKFLVEEGINKMISVTELK